MSAQKAKYCYSFSKAKCEIDKEHATAEYLGGKGYGLVKMCGMGLPVPPGFTIPTTFCKQYMALGFKQRDELLDAITAEAMQGLTKLGKILGHVPLVSVRSGAPVSMPGMMDTILNVGITGETVPLWEEKLGPRAMLDSRRRLVQMMGSTAFGVPAEKFEEQLSLLKDEAGVELDSDLPVPELVDLIGRYDDLFVDHTGHSFPDTVEAQLRAGIKAVFDSWMNPRAIEYRKINKISEAMGTAVTVQAMIFGNTGDKSGSGVAFTRNPSTGSLPFMGEYLPNAQGEDVVAGIRTPFNLLDFLIDADPPWATEFYEMCDRLEDAYFDMVDLEFTVEDDKLFVLQSRVGKRSASAAFKIAHDLFAEGMISKGEALKRLTPAQFKVARRPNLDPKFKTPEHGKGIPACPGVVTGRPVFSSEEAVQAKDKVILITEETTPDDIAGMNKAAGILTRTGGATSHAAVVARAMDKPCVVGATSMVLSPNAFGFGSVLSVKETCKSVTIDGGTGRVWVDVEVPIVDASKSKELAAVMRWCVEMSGKAELVGCELAGTHPQRIAVSELEYDEEALSIVVGDLMDSKSVAHVTLDMRPPVVIDADLRLMFGNVDEDMASFYVYAEELLTKPDVVAKLIDITLVTDGCAPSFRTALSKAGYTTSAFKPVTMADLLNKGCGHPDEDFIKNVVGGEKAWSKIKKVLEPLMPTGGAKQILPAVPAEYATFIVLGA